jgi:hypothetical protein
MDSVHAHFTRREGLIAIKHKGNIERVRNGTESEMGQKKAWITRPVMPDMQLDCEVFGC